MTKRDEVFLGIIAAMTAKQQMMNLQLLHVSADLTSPIVTTQNLESERF